MWMSHSKRHQLWISSELVSKLFLKTFSKCSWFNAQEILARMRGHIQECWDCQQAGRLSRRPFCESCQALTMLSGAQCCYFRARNWSPPTLGESSRVVGKERLDFLCKSQTVLWSLITVFSISMSYAHFVSQRSHECTQKLLEFGGKS